MKKFGFTLAEILITLGIIGVVAALTTPALVKKSGKAKIGPALAKFVNTFETAVEQMMESDTLSELESVNLSHLASFMVITLYSGEYSFSDAQGNKVDDTNSIKAKAQANKNDIYDSQSQSYSGIVESRGYFDCVNDANCNTSEYIKNEQDKLASIHNQIIQDMDNSNIYQLKDGSIMTVIPITRDKISKGAYKGIIAEILYDIDGIKSENKTGKDVFAFLLDRSGILIPQGSNAHKFIEQSGQYYVDNVFNCNYTAANYKNNLACTGKIADNNYKAE